MAEYMSDTVIKAEPDRLFEWLSDLDNLPRYMSRMTSARPSGGDEVAVTAHIETPEGERDVEGHAELHVDQAERQLSWSSEGDHGYGGRLTVVPANEGSRLIITLHTQRADPAGLGLEIQQELDDTVARVRALVEA